MSMDYKRIYEEMNIDWYTSVSQRLEAIFKQAERETNKKFKKINIYIEKAFYGYSMSETDYYILVSDPASYDDDDFENAEPTRKCDLATDFLRDEIIQKLMKAGLDSTYDNEYQGYEVSSIRTDRDNDVGYAFSVTLTDEAKEVNGFNKKGIKESGLQESTKEHSPYASARICCLHNAIREIYGVLKSVDDSPEFYIGMPAEEVKEIIDELLEGTGYYIEGDVEEPEESPEFLAYGKPAMWNDKQLSTVSYNFKITNDEVTEPYALVIRD